MSRSQSIAGAGWFSWRRDVSAAGCVLLAAVVSSWAPLLVAWGNGNDNPFLFNSAWRLGLAAGCFGYALTAGWKLVARSETRRVIVRRLWSRDILLVGLCNSCEYALLAWASFYVGVAMSALLFETYPVFFMFATAAVMDRRYRRPAILSTAFMVIALLGVYCVTVSYSGDWRIWLARGDASTLDLGFGAGLALLSAVAASCAAFSFRWGSGLAGALAPLARGRSYAGLQMFGTLAAAGTASLLALPFNLAAGLTTGAPLDGWDLAIGFAGGILCSWLATTIWRLGSYTTRNLGVNALMYTTPVFTLAWLASFRSVDIASWPYLCVGAVLIVAANVAANFEAVLRRAARRVAVAARLQ